MKPESDTSLWEQAVAAARQRAGGTVPAPVAVAPPPGFGSRLAARWAEWRLNETFRLWCRWSFRAAIAGVLVAIAVVLLPSKPSPPLPLRIPRVEVPSFPSP